MIDGWSIGPPWTPNAHCDVAGVAREAFQKAFPGEASSQMALFSEGSYRATDGQVISLTRSGRAAIAVFRLKSGQSVALGIGCNVPGAFGPIHPPDRAQIDTIEAEAEAYEHRTPRPTK